METDANWARHPSIKGYLKKSLKDDMTMADKMFMAFSHPLFVIDESKADNSNLNTCELAEENILKAIDEMNKLLEGVVRVKLSTIQKRENLNVVSVADDKGPCGANHSYCIIIPVKNSFPEQVEIQFQKGPRKETNASHGVLDTDLLEIVRHRLQSFQEGEFATRENAIALTHIEEALLWMNKRVEDRIERNVLGTYNK